jgi:hypothetical protein
VHSLQNLKEGGVLMKRAKKFSAVVSMAMALLLVLSSTAYAVPISNTLYATFNVGAQTEVTVTDAAGLRNALNNANITTINLAAGRYLGPFEITRDVTIKGAGVDNSFIDAPDDLAGKDTIPILGVEGGSSPIICVANGANVTIKDLTVDGLSKGETSEYSFAGLIFHNAGGTVENVTVQNIRTDDYYQSHGTGIFAFNENESERSLIIKNCNITNYQLVGMGIQGRNLTASITGNTFTGATSDSYSDNDSYKPPTGIIATNIDVDKLTLSDNTFSNNDYDFMNMDVDPVTLTGKIDGSEFEFDEYGDGNISLSPEKNTPVSLELTAAVHWLKIGLAADLILEFTAPEVISPGEITVKVGSSEISPVEGTDNRFILGTVPLNELTNLEFSDITVTFNTGSEEKTYEAMIYVDDGTPEI